MASQTHFFLRGSSVKGVFALKVWGFRVVFLSTTAASHSFSPMKTQTGVSYQTNRSWTRQSDSQKFVLARRTGMIVDASGLLAAADGVER